VITPSVPQPYPAISQSQFIHSSELRDNHLPTIHQPRSNHNTTILRVESKNDSESTIPHPRSSKSDNVELHGLGSSINCLGRRITSCTTRDARRPRIYAAEITLRLSHQTEVEIGSIDVEDAVPFPVVVVMIWQYMAANHSG